MTERDPDLDLDRLFADLRTAGPTASADLMARVLADAAALQPKPALRPVPPPARRISWVARLSAVFGGGGALAGMSFAMVAGVVMGVVQPAPVVALTSVLVADASLDSVELLPDGESLWAEEQND